MRGQVNISAKTVIIGLTLITVCINLLFAPPIAQSTETQNFLRNSDFNSGLACPGFWWTFASGNGTVFSWSESGGIDNSRYIRVEKTVTPHSGTWAQGIESNGRIADYRVAGYVKGEFTNMGPDGGFYIGVECWSKNWTYLGCLDSPHITSNLTDWTLTSIDGYLYADTYHISVTLNMRDCSGWMGWDNVTFNYI